MSLPSFLFQLLDEHDVAPADVEIVEDNVKPSEATFWERRQRFMTTSRCRWSSSDSCLERIRDSDSCLARPSRRGSLILEDSNNSSIFESTRRSSDPSLLRMPRRVESPAGRKRTSYEGSSQNASWGKVDFIDFSKETTTSRGRLMSLLLTPLHQASSAPESNNGCSLEYNKTTRFNQSCKTYTGRSSNVLLIAFPWQVAKLQEESPDGYQFSAFTLFFSLFFTNDSTEKLVIERSSSESLLISIMYIFWGSIETHWSASITNISNVYYNTILLGLQFWEYRLRCGPKYILYSCILSKREKSKSGSIRTHTLPQRYPTIRTSFLKVEYKT
jgi:hypothetical protein